MSSVTQTGIVAQLSETQTFTTTKGPLEKKDLILDTGTEEYPNPIRIEVLGKNFDQIEGLAKGDEVSVDFCVNGREKNGSYWVNLSLRKLSKASAAGKSQEITGSPF
jgi:hypothetical protein